MKSARALPQNQFNCDNQIISNCRPSAICFIGIVWIKVLNSLDEYFTQTRVSVCRSFTTRHTPGPLASPSEPETFLAGRQATAPSPPSGRRW